MSANLCWREIPAIGWGGGHTLWHVAEVGSGAPPILTITSLLHGDEPSGFFFGARYIPIFSEEFEFTGTLRWIPIASPLAALGQSRTAAPDGVDLNRIGLGSETGTMNERILDSLVNCIGDSALVVNLHEFEADSSLVCVHTIPQSDRMADYVQSNISDFSPDVVWLIPGTHGTLNGSIKSFDDALLNRGIPTFSVEFPRFDLIQEIMLDRCFKGISRMLRNNDIGKPRTGAALDFDQQVVPFGELPLVSRHVIRAPEVAVWAPSSRLLEQVHTGEPLGTLQTLPGLSTEEVTSPSTGRVLQIRPHEVVFPGAIVVAIGVPQNPSTTP